MHLSGDQKAIACILIAVIAGTAMDATVKNLGQSVGTWQLLTLRWFFAIILILPLLTLNKKSSIKAKNRSIYFYRAILNCIGSFALFYALSTVPLAVVVTIMFAEPIFIIPFAYLVLNERPSFKDMLAAIIGFGAIVYINNPQQNSLSLSTIAPILAATSYALMHVLTKKFGAKENPYSLMLWLAVATLIISAPLSLDNWRPVNTHMILMSFCIAALGSVYSYFMIIGFRFGSIPKASQVSYLSVPLAFLFGWFFFSETPSLEMIFGSLVILCSTIIVSTDHRSWSELFRILRWKKSD
ncbi:DMT family transporter [Marinobacter sp. NFXS9]|uniref:DMT family transporter n=1 Tax=Marinobacter sp. NFXS9 TaxID=2818433 RepID=UPI0032DFB1C3